MEHKTDLEDLCSSGNSKFKINNDELDRIINVVKELFSEENYKQCTTKAEFRKMMDVVCRRNKIIPSMYKILNVYRSVINKGELKPNKRFELYLRTKHVRSLSGIVNITVFTSPYPETSEGVQKFSCKYDCHYCPKEPNQPRSYLLKEPGVLRANANKFISTDQFWDRAGALISMGHPVDKIELIVSGGTFSSYPREYIDNFFRDQFYAANVTYDKLAGMELRKPLDLKSEQDLNQNMALIKIIGITIETRPDCVNRKEMQYFRKLGVTRVQMGVQHTDDRILRHINRRCLNYHTIRSLKMLKEAGFKVDIHLMPDLPPPPSIDSDEMVEIDRQMFNQIIELPEYQADQWKIYPCETVPWTEIEKWYKEKIYKPYAEQSNPDGSNKLFELLIDVLSRVQPWVRINRVIRDIPNSYIIGGNTNTGMRSDIQQIMEKRGIRSRCIRSREVGDKEIDLKQFEIKVREYPASDGTEYFISWEDSDEVLLGFIRLRLNESRTNAYFPELSDCAMIRELHVYGQVITHDSESDGVSVQHRGLGKALISKAVEIAQLNGYSKVSVIAGVGVRNYYIKQGFVPIDYYVGSNGDLVQAQGNFLIMDIISQPKSATTVDDFPKRLLLLSALILLAAVWYCWR